MYGLAVMLSISRRTTIKNIDMILLFYRLRSNGIGATIQNERLGYFSHQGQTKNGRKVYVREQNGAQTQYLYFWDWGPNNGANWFIGLDPQLKPRGNTMAEISISIEIKYFGGDNNIIATFNIIPCINQCIFMYLKWLWLLSLFA